MIARRFQSADARYRLCCSGRAGVNDNNGAGYSLDAVYSELRIQLAWVTDGYPRRVAKQGLKWLVISDDAPTVSYWIERMEGKDVANS